MLKCSFPFWGTEKRQAVIRGSCSSHYWGTSRDQAPAFPFSRKGVAKEATLIPTYLLTPRTAILYLLALLRLTRGSFKNLNAQILNRSLWKFASETPNYSPLILKE